jgi:hypothetical protein
MKTLTSNIKNFLLDEISKAEFEIKIAVCWFNDIDIYKLLVQKAKNSVCIEIIITNDHINIEKNKINWFEIIDNGGQVYLYKKGHTMHLKECLIDNKTFIQGTYNWTNKASRNVERISIYYNNEFDIKNTKTEYDEIKLQCEILVRNEKKSYFKSEIRFVNGKYGVFERDSNEPWIPAIYDEIGKFSWNALYLRKNNEGGFVNEKLEWIIPLNSQFKNASKFINGFSIVKSTGSIFYNKNKVSDTKFYLIDIKGNVVLSKELDLAYYENIYHYLFNTSIIYCLKSYYVRNVKTRYYISYRVILNSSKVSIGNSDKEVIVFDNVDNTPNNIGIYNNIKGVVSSYMIDEGFEKIENVFIKTFGDRDSVISILIYTNLEIYNLCYLREKRKIVNLGKCDNFVINFNSVFIDNSYVLTVVENTLLRFKLGGISRNNYYIKDKKLYVCYLNTLSIYELKIDKVILLKSYNIQTTILLKDYEYLEDYIISLNNGTKIKKINYYESDNSYIYRKFTEFVNKCEYERELEKKKLIEIENQKRLLLNLENERKIDIIEKQYNELVYVKENKQKERTNSSILCIVIGVFLLFIGFIIEKYHIFFILPGLFLIYMSISVLKAKNLDIDLKIKNLLAKNQDLEKRLKLRRKRF